MPDPTVSLSEMSTVRRFVCWPEEQGPPEGWPTVYVDADDWDRLEAAARRVLAEVKKPTEWTVAIEELRAAVRARCSLSQRATSELEAWEALSRLDAIASDHPHDSIEIEKYWKPSELPWSCNIRCGEHGYGTGSTMVEAIVDALRDLDEHS